MSFKHFQKDESVESGLLLYPKGTLSSAWWSQIQDFIILWIFVNDEFEFRCFNVLADVWSLFVSVI